MNGGGTWGSVDFAVRAWMYRAIMRVAQADVDGAMSWSYCCRSRSVPLCVPRLPWCFLGAPPCSLDTLPFPDLKQELLIINLGCMEWRVSLILSFNDEFTRHLIWDHQQRNENINVMFCFVPLSHNEMLWEIWKKRKVGQFWQSWGNFDNAKYVNW